VSVAIEPRRLVHLEAGGSADRTEATLTFLATSSDPFSLTATTEDLDELIQMLGTMRLNLTPEVPTECPDGDRVVAVDPELFVDRHPDGDPILHVRSVRYGWQHFQLPRALANQVAKALMG
jgi:hypothetical protein